MPSALITGGTGFVGRYLAARLLAMDYEVVGTRYLEADPSVAFDTAPLDVRDATAVARLVADARPDEIYHLAGLSRPTLDAARDYYDVHLHGTLNVLEAVRAAGLDHTRTLVVGSAYAYGAWDEIITETTPLEPLNHYGASKAAGDLAARAVALEGLVVVRARPFNHTGPGQSPSFVVPAIVEQVRRIAEGAQPPTLHLGRVDPTRDFLDVRDVVEAYRQLLVHGVSGEAYNIASGNGTTIADVVDLAREVSGVGFELVTEPARVRAHDLPYLVGDAGKLRSTTGWAPRHTLRDTLRDMFESPGS